MEHDVFISYSRKDEELVKKIRAALTQANISYWIDKEEIKRGTSYAKAISQAVYNSKILLFIWSEHSNNSENTANEISLALEFEKNIVPFKISKKLGPSDMTYHLLKLDRIDACPFESHHIQELVASIAQCLGRGLTPSSTTSGTSGSTPIRILLPPPLRLPILQRWKPISSTMGAIPEKWQMENSTDRGLIAGPTGVDMKDNGKTGICTDGVFFIMPTEANIKEIG